jgi:glycosyltransferase involved in cell wall biosynthesis
MAAPFSVLHVLAPARYGGLERVVASLVAGQIDAGLDARVLAIVEPGESKHPFLEGLRRDGLAPDAIEIPPRRYSAERNEVVRWCSRTRPTLVHLHGARPDVLLGGVIRRAGFPVASTVHGFTGGDLKNRFYEALQRRALRRMDAVAAVSRPMSEDLVRQGCAKERMHLIPNAAPRRGEQVTRAAARGELGIRDGERVIGWVGRLTAEKGCDLFVAALAQIGRADVGASIIGSGPERARLEGLGSRPGHGAGIRWHGELPSAGRLLTAFDLFVMSSRTEGTPMVLFEAIQAGVPVVVTSVGGIPDVVSTSEALLVPPEDASALAAAMRRSLDEPAESAARAARARARIEADFSLGRWVERYSDVYAAAVRNRR